MAIGQSLPDLSTDIVNRFWGKVNTERGQGSTGTCWEWQGSCDHTGYGRFHLVKLDRQAHRVVYKIYYGDDAPGLEIRHKCHNRRCVHPLHLKVGTHKENMQDMVDAGRTASLRGSANGHAILTEKDVLTIRQRYKDGETQQQLANAFNVLRQSIWLIVHRKQWQHI